MSSSVVVCPACHGPLVPQPAGGCICSDCSVLYADEAGRPALLATGEERFDDEADCCLFDGEETTNSFTTRSYSLPLLRRLLGARLAGARVLSAGCGVGIDVDILRDNGVEAYGLDCGSRIEAWPRRRHPSAFQIGSVVNLPYADGSFDAVMTGCLLPHIGVVGDTSKVQRDVVDKRRRTVAELLRVTRPGGHIVMGNPNRLCPADLFHKRQMAGAHSLVRWHSPAERFLLSFSDHVELFGRSAVLRTLPNSNYWGFHTKRTSPFTWVLAQTLRAYFAVLSVSRFEALRRSALNPWLMVLATKVDS